MDTTFDVIIIGGGHAGIEAAHACASLGSATLLLTLDSSTIGLMPCNPSIGGLGKGHMVYELSALGGLMPRLCSETYLQSRMLNTKKGPAVQGLRLQIDKYAYKAAAQRELKNTKNLTIIDGLAAELLIASKDENKHITGVKTKDGRIFKAQAVVITAGTFLNGRVYIGEEHHDAGRMGEKSAKELSDSLMKIMGVEVGRLKTGTPPRLLRESIDVSSLERQESHALEFLFEFKAVHATEKIPCYITYTNEKTHQVIKDNLTRSAMYNGHIKGTGPRYCPSIEDKISRFPDRNSHHIFIEPEGGDNTEVYPGGLSTSLPLDVQEDYIHSIKGFEKAVITQPGYAVEYDFVQPTHLSHSLETKSVKGLFFAGQINGTTGYEEAAGQGIIAGINAHLKVAGKEPFTLSRTESYIGVMIDDLVTLGADEPYRMFTSRAERRLLLRQDNVFLRLMPYGRKLGLIDEATYSTFLAEKALLEASIKLVKKAGRRSELFAAFDGTGFDKAQQEVAKGFLVKALNINDTSIHEYRLLHQRLLLGIHAEIKYDGYLEQERKEAQKAETYQNLALPKDMDFSVLPGLSSELQQKLTRIRPQTIAQAQLIPGITPAAISLLIFQTRTGSQKERS